MKTTQAIINLIGEDNTFEVLGLLEAGNKTIEAFRRLRNYTGLESSQTFEAINQLKKEWNIKQPQL